ncbi:hypothetical protein ACQJBY_067655 [Aegilops geniculata]
MSSWSASKAPTTVAVGVAIRSGGRGSRHEERQPKKGSIGCVKHAVAGLRDSLPITLRVQACNNVDSGRCVAWPNPARSGPTNGHVVCIDLPIQQAIHVCKRS